MYNDIPAILRSFSKRIIETRNLPEKMGSFSSIPAICDANLKKCLINMGYEKLYSHQAEMFEKAIKDNNVIITSAASHKFYS